MIVHYAKSYYDIPECGHWNILEAVHKTANPRKVTCNICEDRMKKIFKPTDTFTWSDKAWNQFMGREEK